MPRSSTTLEPVIAGQPKAATLAKMNAASGFISLETLSWMVSRVENARTEFSAAAVEAGLLLLAKKQTLKHGEFGQLCALILAHMRGKNAKTIDAEDAHAFTRTLRKYMFLGQHFLADLEQGHFAGEIGSQRLVALPEASPEQVVALALGSDCSEQVRAAIVTFCAGRSLRRMLIDFRRAETAAEADEVKEAAEAEGRKRSSKKLPEQAPGQMDFLQDFYRPISQLDTLMSSPTYVKHTTKQFWSNLADKLEAQAGKARQMAKEIAG